MHIILHQDESYDHEVFENHKTKVFLKNSSTGHYISFLKKIQCSQALKQRTAPSEKNAYTQLFPLFSACITNQ